ncbi:hypothetical protein [Pedobacter jamesrossensis]|uniref:Uncharacterized protein n=1 Tax=Pedobacter jamesrossensis TaxID=1908238 RepID=A0ABV8NPI3_9SPHI
MSIFPKRGLRGTSITIHWNFNTSSIKESHICPLVRIGVKDPKGNISMLFEKHVLSLPAIKNLPESSDPVRPLYLNKNFPLLVVAEYLSGKYSREKLVDILENIQGGRHFYFVYQVPGDAALGKYTLISEVISGGEVRYSKTAEDDFFFIEDIEISNCINDGQCIQATITNHSPEPAPVKVVAYHANGELSPTDIDAYELSGNESRKITVKAPYGFVSYNEEREILPLQAEPRIIKNPYYLSLNKEDKRYILYRDSDSSYILDEETRKIWDFSDGLEERSTLAKIANVQFEEMLSNQLIYPIDERGNIVKD